MYIRTPEEFAAAVTVGTTTETLTLDFKGTIDHRLPKGTPDHVKQKAQQETCRDIAQFANTNGGCLLIGVEEGRDPVTGLKVAVGIASARKPDEMREWIEEAVKNYLVPATFRHSIDIIQVPSATMVCVNIPPSLHLVALWHSERKSQSEEKHSIEYLYRDSYGKKWMNPSEVERHIMNGSRATKIAFDAAWAQASVKEVYLVGGYWERGSGVKAFLPVRPNPSATVGAMNDQSFELRIRYQSSTKSLNLPFGLVEQVWVGSDRRMHLFLSVRVLHHSHDGAFTIERYD